MCISEKHKKLRKKALLAIEVVSKINPEAAEYLLNLYKQVPEDSTETYISKSRGGYILSANVNLALTWVCHKKYPWKDIHRKCLNLNLPEYF